jgi:predicted ATP-dependent serine protease
VDGLIAAGGLHLITGDAGAGKSTLVSALGYAVSTGQDFLGRAVSQRPVLLLDAENPAVAVGERFRRLHIQSHEGFRLWGFWVGDDPPRVSDSIVADWVTGSTIKPLIIVDSLVAFHPGAENDSTETRRYMLEYRKLAATGATIVLLHHIGKSEGARDYRGSSDIKASIDIGFKLTSASNDSLSSLELRAFKQRFAVDSPLSLHYDDGVFRAVFSTSQKVDDESFSEILGQNPGITGTRFEEIATTQNYGRNRARRFLNDGVRKGTILRAGGMNNAKCCQLSRTSATNERQGQEAA